ncbi:hypothetical protein NZL82_14345 [Sphingomonas sanguinis]|nr:hypothetical protein [Sphingomonas sp. LC-1]MCT8003057.1 hypothetical protein [Sphingomonas sp. LC-1]
MIHSAKGDGIRIRVRIVRSMDVIAGCHVDQVTPVETGEAL